MTTRAAKCTVYRYADGKAIGEVDLTKEQWARYEALAQQPEGLVRLGAMPHDLYDLYPECQDIGPDAVIYLEM